MNHAAVFPSCLARLTRQHHSPEANPRLSPVKSEERQMLTLLGLRAGRKGKAHCLDFSLDLPITLEVGPVQRWGMHQELTLGFIIRPVRKMKTLKSKQDKYFVHNPLANKQWDWDLHPDLSDPQNLAVHSISIDMPLCWIIST